MRILYVVHALPPLDVSGTPLIAWQYATQAVKAGHRVAIAFPRPAGGRSIPPAEGIELLPLAPAAEQWTLAAFTAPPKRDEAMLAALRKFRPDIVHIVDWVDLPSALLASIRALTVPVIRQVWNFEDVCAFIEPIRFHPDYRLCRAPLADDQCGECLVRRQGTIRATLDAPIDAAIARLTEARAAMKADFTAKVTAKRAAWRRHVGEFYDALLFPCASFARYFSSLAEIDSIPQRVVEHGIVAAKSAPPPRPPGSPLRCVFLGPCTGRKGWEVIEQSFAQLLPQAAGRLTLTVAGGKAVAERTVLAGLPGVELRDRFAPDELSALLAGGDVGLLPSPFETFSRACREMLAHGLAVIGSDAFGIPDAVTDGINGLLIGEPSVAGLSGAIRRLVDEDGLLARLTEGARTTALRSPEEEFAELAEVYRTVKVRRRSASALG